MTTIDTGVEWCRLRITPELEQLVQRVHDLERDRAWADVPGAASSARALSVKGVGAAEQLADNPALSDDELAARCLALRGEPWAQAGARRDMRERVRIWRVLEQGRARIPRDIDGLLALWAEATQGEVAVYSESETAQLRRGIPFAHGEDYFVQTTPTPGRQTVDPSAIEGETRKLLAFMQRSDITPELHAAMTLFALWYIHPVRDGNGHLGRMLACTMLAGSYATPTLLAFVSLMQAKRAEISRTIVAIVRGQEDLGPFVHLFLATLHEALVEA